ncbi:MAG: hypothetical protein ACON4N_04535 [Myxococcota bacterium]
MPVATNAGDDLLVLRAHEGRDLSESPVALVRRRTGESTAVSNSSATFLPFWILDHLLVEPPEAWAALEGASDSDWDALGELHAGLGGEDAMMVRLRNVLGQEAYREALSPVIRRQSPKVVGERWCAAMFDVGIGDTGRCALLELIRQVSRFESWEDPLPERFGVFTGAGWGCAMQRGKDADRKQQAALQAVLLPSGHEAAYSSLSLRPVAPPGRAQDHQFSLLARAAKKVNGLETVPGKDEHAAAWATVAAYSGDLRKYDGLLHAEAAAVYRSQGAMGAAVRCLLSALFWSNAAYGTVNEPMVPMYQQLLSETEMKGHQEALDGLLRGAQAPAHRD